MWNAQLIKGLQKSGNAAKQQAYGRLKRQRSAGLLKASKATGVHLVSGPARSTHRKVTAQEDPRSTMIYDVNSPLFKQFLSEKVMRKTAAKDKDKAAGASKGASTGKDRAMAHPASVGC
ncbi:hypothetical protein AK812_SmicGene30287 [Symbiodinium microadriaticum]|uniref:Uncharacterized protein n=1 Tax=Symbiodinium microadriaticum TaxID=2951 RepID=A0A1Q9CZP0_SYMMI|nr:hypothetical protein AK812_SmicGene30287 [Symbiodinium microadriaticum]